MEKQVRDIMDDYYRLVSFAGDNAFEIGDLFDDWAKTNGKRLSKVVKAKMKKKMKKVCEDLVEMCEDNDEMKSAIQEYFGVKPPADMADVE